MNHRSAYAALALVALCSPALAQSVTVEPAQPGPRNFTLTVSEKDLNVIGTALGELKLREALPTFTSIDRQVSEQRAEAKAAKPPEPTPKAPEPTPTPKPETEPK